MPVALGKQTRRVRFDMVYPFIVIIAVFVLLYWLLKINKEYYVLAFFARRARATDGRFVDNIAPILKGNTIFGNVFDLCGKDDAGTFRYYRDAALEMGKSYLIYACGSPMFNIIDPVNAEFVLSNPTLITKSIDYDFMQPALHKGLLTSSGKKWHTRRKMITPTFKHNVLVQFEEIFRAESQKFVKQFDHQEESIVSLPELIPRFSLNSICETAMGINLDDMTERGDRYRESMKMFEKCFVKTFTNPLHYYGAIYKLFPINENIPYLKVVHDFTNDIIAKRQILLEEELNERRCHQLPDDDIYVNKKRRFAMLDTLICAEKDGLIDHAGICEEVNTLMFGGFDPSSIALMFTIFNLSLYEDMQELCYQEILEHIHDHNNLDINQLSNRRQTSEETVLPNGLILPTGSQIIMHVFDLHRNPKYWDQPDVFDPDRFLPQNSVKRHAYAYIPFSMGLRNCLAQQYFMILIKTLLCFILKKFKILPVTHSEDLVFHMGLTLRVENNIKVKFVLRNK
ncbi:cytochrome P450 4p1 isoform X2 [Drosophila mojavensis]|uniref:cytochrome P450 4p1 isoform X2 n=1 Tax=Drosophila mojavensis TaxID=7230 RepID=UPI001CD166D9|nr:cytochrome P450 4p1 isoform X2 [Drosophila mojavensis]